MKANEPLTAGVDVGGGTVKFGLMDAADRVVLRGSFATLPTPEDTFAELRGRLEEMGADYAALGVAVPGPLSAGRDFLGALPNLPGWSGKSVREILADRFDVPFVMENDANAAAFAEAASGAGRGCRTVLMLTLGTGIGGGIVHDGGLFRGAQGAAGEIGHITIREGGPPCGCGKRGCLEALAGSRALRTAFAGKGRSREEAPPLAEIIALARGGDKRALGVFETAGGFIGEAVAAAVNILNPDCVIIGGGVAEAGEPLLEAVRRSALPRVMPHLRSFRLVRAALGNEAGFIGAALLARGKTGGT